MDVRASTLVHLLEEKKIQLATELVESIGTKKAKRLRHLYERRQKAPQWAEKRGILSSCIELLKAKPAIKNEHKFPTEYDSKEKYPDLPRMEDLYGSHVKPGTKKTLCVLDIRYCCDRCAELVLRDLKTGRICMEATRWWKLAHVEKGDCLEWEWSFVPDLKHSYWYLTVPEEPQKKKADESDSE